MRKKNIAWLILAVIIAVVSFWPGRWFLNIVMDKTEAVMDQTIALRHQKAIFLARQGNYDTALAEMVDLLDKTGHDPNILADFVLILAWAGKCREAVEAGDRLPRKKTLDMNVLLALGRCCRKIGQLQSALDLFETVLLRDSDNRQAFRGKIDVYMDIGDYDQALAGIQQWATDYGSSLWLSRIKAEAMHRQAVDMARRGDHDRALAIIENIPQNHNLGRQVDDDHMVILSWAGRHRQAIALHNSSGRKMDGPAYVMSALADSYRVAGQDSMALPLYMKVLGQNQEDRYALRQIVGLYRKNDRMGALEVFVQRQLETAPDEPVWLKSVLADIRRTQSIESGRRGDLEAAVDLSREAWQLSGRQPEFLHDHVTFLSRSGKHSEALELTAQLPEEAGVPDYVIPELARSHQAVEKSVTDSGKRLKLPGSVVKSRQWLAARVKNLLAAGQFNRARTLVDAKAAAGVIGENERQRYTTDITHQQAVAAGRSGDLASALPLIREAVQSPYGKPPVQWDYIVLLGRAGHHQEAVSVFESLSGQLVFPCYLLTAAADSYKELKRFHKAEENYLRCLKCDSGNMEAQAGLFRLAILQNDIVRAESRLAAMSKVDPDNITVLFCRAELAEARQDLIIAYHVYTRIRRLYPANQRATDNACRVLLDLGATSLVREKTVDEKIVLSRPTRQLMLGNEARDRIMWQEPGQADELIRRNLSDISAQGKDTEAPAAGLRALSSFERRELFDQVVALALDEDNQGCLEKYRALTAMIDDIPYWVIEPVAGAVLRLRLPEDALALYELARRKRERQGLDCYPDNFQNRIGSCKALSMMGRYRQSGEVLDDLEKTVPPFRVYRGVWQKNWHKPEVDMERAWWLIDQDRLAEAESFLTSLQSRAPFNTGLRGALAHVHLRRGWPRQAEEDFRIALGIHDDLVNWTGYVESLETNDRGEQARLVLDALCRKYPDNDNVQKTAVRFAVRDMRRLVLDAGISLGEEYMDGGFWSLRLEQPLYPWRRLFVETIRRHAEDDDRKTVIRRHRLGCDWRFSRDWWFWGGLSLDWDGRETGFNADLTFQPDDRFSFSVSGNSYDLELPPKALLNELEGRSITLGAAYHRDELFSISGKTRYLRLSDDNRNMYYNLVVRQAMTVGTRWRSELALEGALTTNSETETLYYSPESVGSFYLIPVFEHLWYQQDPLFWQDRISVGVGGKKERGYPTAVVWLARYGHDVRLSDTVLFSLTGTCNNTVYEGDREFSWGMTFSMAWSF